MQSIVTQLRGTTHKALSFGKNKSRLIYKDRLLLLSAPCNAANRKNGSFCFNIRIKNSWSLWDFFKHPSFYSSLAHRRSLKTKIWLSQDFWFSNKKNEFRRVTNLQIFFLNKCIYIISKFGLSQILNSVLSICLE